MKTFVLILTLLFGVSSISICQEKKIPRKQVPASVIKAFKSTYPNAKIKGTNKEIKDGVTYFEIESKDGKVSRDILYTHEGTVSEIEEIISADQLPQPVTDVLTKSYLNKKVVSVEKNIQGSETTYEVILQNGKKKQEVIFSPVGNILNNK